MTFDASQPSNDPAVADQRCLRYLLGELDSTETRAFETELGESSDLNDELLRQSDLLCHLSASIASAPITAQPLVSHHRSHWQWITAIAALAACLTIVVGSFQANDRDQTVASVDRGVPLATVPVVLSEESLIAQAWATSRADNLVSEYDLTTNDFEYELVSTQASQTEEVLGADSAFSWMVYAIPTDAESKTERESSDG